ncbi:T9SS type B sorting domain-containing protein [Maribacter chungangensis]|uniref:T9SS type B sorting domain-containing protein n=1 Tax=Maribacter chungangensis TaxID=1069117 RepID=A0ABW3B197_9FLAO
MKKLGTLVLLIGLLLPMALWAQGETANWYFGEQAGLKFNNDGSVNALTDGRLNTFEGCATISNAFGDLLFYTDGIIVYDRNHNIMENGSGLFGDPSSTQSAIIVPKPEDPNIYFIFTVDTSIAENDPDRGLNYSTVDISLNNGNGAVVQKNRRLLQDCSEKIAAVRKNCFDQSIWVVTLASENGTLPTFNTYHAFEVNTLGVANISVKTTFPDLAIDDPRGALKFAPSGTMMASANMFFGLQLYDFDSDTGLFSNQIQLPINEPDQFPYGIEFSSKGQYLYTHSTRYNENETYLSLLSQFDVLAQDIPNSQVVLDRRPIFRGALQIGSNGKIYRTLADDYFNGIPFLSVINTPDAKGDGSNYVHRSISLGGRIGTQGLPPFIQSFFDKTDLLVDENGNASNFLELCEGAPFTLETEAFPGATYNWSKDGIPFHNPDENRLVVDSSELVDAGRYQLEIVFSDPQECPILGEALIMLQPRPQGGVLNLKQCDIDANSSDGITTVNLNQLTTGTTDIYRFYESEENRENNLAIANVGNYSNRNPFEQTLYYQVTNPSGCVNMGTLELEILPIPFRDDTVINLYECDVDPNDGELSAIFDLSGLEMNQMLGFEVAFYGNLTDASLEQNPLNKNMASATTLIYARLENSNQCENIVRINLIVNPSPTVQLQDNYLLCTNDPQLVLEAPAGFDLYRWTKITGGAEETMGTNLTFNGTEIGSYTLTVGFSYPGQGTNQVCEYSFPFTISPSNPASIKKIIVEDLADNNTIQVFAEGDGDYEYAIDGMSFQNDNLFEDMAPGRYEITVRDKNGCGTIVQKTAVLGYPKFFTPNGDGINDYWQLIGLEENFSANASISIFDRYGKLVANLTNNNPTWNGTWNSSPLPADDYWFMIALEGGRELKGHFSLKR